MNSITRLLNPRSLAIVGASPRGGRGARTLVNLREAGFRGEVFAVHPRYDEVLGFACYPSIEALPAPVDCVLLAIGAEAACAALEAAFARGIEAAVVLAAGFGEGGENAGRAERLRRLGERGMSICGPNCYGLISVKEGATASAYSGRLPKPLVAGGVALVSQSGSLANNAFTPLMADRRLGFRYVVSCGNQIATAIEDYIAAFVDDDDVRVIACVVESINDPGKLRQVVRDAHGRGKKLVFYQVGRSELGRRMTRSHTGALVGNSDLLAAFLRRCGIVCTDTYDEFVEAIELLAVAPPDREVAQAIVVISGSGGGAAIAADTLDGSGLDLPAFDEPTLQRLRAVLPEFGHVTNPLDGTGAMSDDPSVLEGTLAAIAAPENRAMIAVTINARQPASAKEQRYTEIVAQWAQRSGRVMIAYQYSPLGGPLDARIVTNLQSANVPLLLGTAMAMRVARYLPLAQAYRRDALARNPVAEAPSGIVAARLAQRGFLAVRQALVDAGVAVVEAELATSEHEAVAAFRAFGAPVALKAEAEGLLHKSDVGCVRLNCTDEAEVAAAYRSLVENARRAGFPAIDGVLVQPMVGGVAEVFAGVLDDARLGPAISLGLGGIFVEIYKDVVTEVAPLTPADAMGMIRRLKAAPLLLGARGRPAGDVEALAEWLVRLGRFAQASAGRFRTLDLNPVIVKAKGEGVVAVDLAIE